MRRLIFLGVIVAAIAVLCPREGARAGGRCVVPASWGPLKSMTESSSGFVLFAFEDEHGTVRVTPAGCKPGAVSYQVDRN